MEASRALKKIIISESRIKLLQVLFYLPGEIYYVRQLTKLTGEEIHSVRRELKNLKEAEILKSEWRANRLFYWANRQHCFFSEILSLVLKTDGLGREIIKNRQRLGKIKFVAFSGKFARCLPREKDEVDLFVVGRVVLPELGALVRKEERRRRHEINYTVMEEEQFKFRKKNRDPFLTQILLQGKLMIVGDEQKMINF